MNARDLDLDAMAEELLEIADTPQLGVRTRKGPNGDITETGDMVDHRRLQVDARKWYLSKLAPKRYGHKLALEHSGDLGIIERLQRARKRTG